MFSSVTLLHYCITVKCNVITVTCNFGMCYTQHFSSYCNILPLLLHTLQKSSENLFCTTPYSHIRVLKKMHWRTLSWLWNMKSWLGTVFTYCMITCSTVSKSAGSLDPISSVCPQRWSKHTNIYQCFRKAKKLKWILDSWDRQKSMVLAVSVKYLQTELG